MKNKETQKKGKVKTWFMDNKELLVAVGFMAVGGVVSAFGMYKIGYHKGYDRGLTDVIKTIPDGKVMEF